MPPHNPEKVGIRKCNNCGHYTINDVCYYCDYCEPCEEELKEYIFMGVK